MERQRDTERDGGGRERGRERALHKPHSILEITGQLTVLSLLLPSDF